MLQRLSCCRTWANSWQKTAFMSFADTSPKSCGNRIIGRRQVIVAGPERPREDSNPTRSSLNKDRHEFQISFSSGERWGVSAEYNKQRVRHKLHANRHAPSRIVAR